MRVGTGASICWRSILAVGAGVVLATSITGCGGPSVAQTIMSKIPGCSSVTTSGGDSLDDNTISEGSCTLPDGTSLNAYVWAAGDASDLEQYVYWNPVCASSFPPPDNAPDGCIVGNRPQPWFIDISTSNYAMTAAQSDWAAVEAALNGEHVSHIPASWQDGTGTLLVTQRSPSPSPTPSPSQSRKPHHRARHHHRVVVVIPPPAQSSAPASSGAWCTATASVYNAEYNWNNVYVNSNQPYTDATASADGYSWSYQTNGSGYAEIYLNGPPAGAEITVTVGGATCTTSD
jgi:hypothetical protein